MTLSHPAVPNGSLQLNVYLILLLPPDLSEWGRRDGAAGG